MLGILWIELDMKFLKICLKDIELPPEAKVAEKLDFSGYFYKE